jgi:hypothetical protein
MSDWLKAIVGSLIANAIWVIVLFLMHQSRHTLWTPKREGVQQALFGFYHVNTRDLYVLGALLLLAGAVDLVLFFTEHSPSFSFFVVVWGLLWTYVLYGFLIGTIYNLTSGHPLLTPWW